MAGPDTAQDELVARGAAVNRPLPGWMGGVVVVPAVIAVLLWAGGIHNVWITIPALLACLLMSGASWLAVRRRIVDVRASARGLTLGDAALVPRAGIEDAMVLPRPGLPPRLRIHRRGLALPLQVEVADDAQAQRLLRALGLDAAHTAVGFRVPSRILGNSGLVFGAIVSAFAALLVTLVLAHILGPGTLDAFPAVWLSLFLALLVPRRLTVGADGVLFTSLGRKRFIPYVQMKSVDTYETVSGGGGGRTGALSSGGDRVVVVGRFGVAIELEAERVEIPLGRGNAERASMAIERIREAMQAVRAPGEDLEAALVRPRSLDANEWMAHLRSLALGATSPFRGAPVTLQRLWDIVEDSGGPPEARAAAAVVLGAELDEEGRSRLRVLAEATVSPRLRVVLGGVAEERPTEDLAVALDEVCSKDGEEVGTR